jgi:hypothetical protein
MVSPVVIQSNVGSHHEVAHGRKDLARTAARTRAAMWTAIPPTSVPRSLTSPDGGRDSDRRQRHHVEQLVSGVSVLEQHDRPPCRVDSFGYVGPRLSRFVEVSGLAGGT